MFMLPPIVQLVQPCSPGALGLALLRYDRYRARPRGTVHIPYLRHHPRYTPQPPALVPLCFSYERAAHVRHAKPHR